MKQDGTLEHPWRRPNMKFERTLTLQQSAEVLAFFDEIKRRQQEFDDFKREGMDRILAMPRLHSVK